MEHDVVDVTCSKNSAKFVVTGPDATAAAEIESTGQARFPLDLIPKLKKIAASFGSEAVRIRVENGPIRINSMSVSNPDITVSEINDRPIDIPDDAPILDIVALQFLFTSDELASSNLMERFVEADKTRIKALKSAASTLAPLGLRAKKWIIWYLTR